MPLAPGVEGHDDEHEKVGKSKLEKNSRINKVYLAERFRVLFLNSIWCSVSSSI
jgi:hypothetical protein